MIYPTERDFRWFVGELQNEEYSISRFLPAVSDDWYVSVGECVGYLNATSRFSDNDVCQEASRILYKIVKKHDFVDSNKRSAVISVYLFCLLNGYAVLDPVHLKRQATRIAKTKGRKNEELMIRRVSVELKTILEHMNR